MDECISTIPECLAAALVDLTTGLLLGIRTVDSHPREVIDLVAAATGDLFQGPNVSAIERTFRKVRGIQNEDGYHYLQEVILSSDNLLHVFFRGRANPDNVLVVVCRRAANLGMVLARAKTMIPKVEAAAAGPAAAVV